MAFELYIDLQASVEKLEGKLTHVLKGNVSVGV
jgi:hypothetical protein